MTAITSNLLAAALTQDVINGAFDIVRSNRTGILSVVGFGGPLDVQEGYKTSWLDTRIDATSSTLTAGVNNSVTTIPVADGSKFRAGMTASAVGSDEVVLVTAVSGNNLTVTRGFGSTTAAAISSGVSLVIDSIGREENSLAETDGIYQPDVVENFFQTMDTTIEMPRRSLATRQHGNTNDLNFQLQLQLAQLATQMDRALVRGRKATATINSKVRTYTGGIRYFMDQAGAIKQDHSGAALSLDAISGLNAEIVSRGGSANTIAVGIAKARKLNALVSANYNSQRLVDWSNDEGAVNRLPSDLPLVGNVTNIIIDTNLSDNELVIFDSGMVSVKHMAQNNAGASGAWRTLDATTPGQDGQSVRVIGDFVMEVRQSKTHMARLHNIA